MPEKVKTLNKDTHFSNEKMRQLLELQNRDLLEVSDD